MKQIHILLFLLISITLFAQEEAGQDYDLKWKKFKSKEFSFKCRMPLEHIVNLKEHEFGKEIQVSSEHDFLSFYISAMKRTADLSNEDPEELAISSVYSFLNAMEGELVYMRADQHSGAIGYESRIKVENEMQARYAVYIKGQMQYHVVMVFLSDASEVYFHDLLKGLKFK